MSSPLRVTQVALTPFLHPSHNPNPAPFNPNTPPHREEIPEEDSPTPKSRTERKGRPKPVKSYAPKAKEEEKNAKEETEDGDVVEE